MKCPFCGEEMELGRIIGGRDSGVPWLPNDVSNANLGWTGISNRLIQKRGGIMLIPGKTRIGSPNHFAELPTYICRKCKKGVFPYEEN